MGRVGGQEMMMTGTSGGQQVSMWDSETSFDNPSCILYIPSLSAWGKEVVSVTPRLKGRFLA